MTMAAVMVEGLQRAGGQLSKLARRLGDDRPGAAALSRLRGEVTRSDTRWLPEALVGALPPGIHDVSAGAFAVQLGDTAAREGLLRHFALRLEDLARRGVREIYVGGSMTTTKNAPRDIDVLIPARDAGKLGLRARMTDMAKGIHWHEAEARHHSTNPLWGHSRPTWLEFFQHDRQLQQRGIARVRLTLPRT